MDQEIEFGRKGGLATVLLNRPKALNALTHEMCVELHARLKQWRADESVRAVVVQGAGDRHGRIGEGLQYFEFPIHRVS